MFNTTFFATMLKLGKKPSLTCWRSQQLCQIQYELLADCGEVKLVLWIMRVHQIMSDFMSDREIPAQAFKTKISI